MSPAHLLVIATFVFGGVACTSEVKITIAEPERGAQIQGAQDVTLDVQAEADSVVVESGGKRFVTLVPGQVKAPAADGLGFASVRIEGDPLIAVRSWQQGAFQPADTVLKQAVSVRLGGRVLDEGRASVAGVVEEMLRRQDLTNFVKESLEIEVGVLFVDKTVQVTPRSIVTGDIDIRLEIKNSRLMLNAALKRVRLDFETDQTTRITGKRIDGTAIIDRIDLNAEIKVHMDGATLSNPIVTSSEPDVTDGGRVPSKLMQLLAPKIQKEIPAAFATAAGRACDEVVRQLLRDLRPQVALDFVASIDQEVELASVEVDGRSIFLHYDMRVVASDPILEATHGFLIGQDGVHKDIAGATVRVGRTALNQFAYAAWSAGNFAKINFTRQELHRLGLPSLKFPYNRLRDVDIKLMLPPLFAWDGDEARVDIGGINAHIEVNDGPDMRAHAAGSIPVELCRSGDSMRLCASEDRDVEVFDVEFNQISDFANRDVTVGLMRAVAHGVVERVLATVPTVEIPPMEFMGTDGRLVARIATDLHAVKDSDNGWLLDLSVRLVDSGQP